MHFGTEDGEKVSKVLTRLYKIEGIDTGHKEKQTFQWQIERE